MKVVAAITVALMATAAKTVVLVPTLPTSTATLDRSASIIRARLTDDGLRATVRRGAGTIRIRFVNSPIAAELATLVERGRLEILDLEGDLVPPSIDRQGNPVAARTPPKARTGTAVVSCGGSATNTLLCPGDADPARKSYYLVRPFGALTNRELARARVRWDIGVFGNPIVRLSFTPVGAREFQGLTRRLYLRGQLRRAAQHFAIVLDDRIVAYPQIDWTDSTLAHGISGGGEITGVTVSEARSIAAVLRVEELPVSLRIVR